MFFEFQKLKVHTLHICPIPFWRWRMCIYIFSQKAFIFSAERYRVKVLIYTCTHFVYNALLDIIGTTIGQTKLKFDLDFLTLKCYSSDRNSEKKKLKVKVRFRLLNIICLLIWNNKDHRGHDHMVVGFKTTYAISTYHQNVVSLNPTQVRCTWYNIMW